MKRLVTSAGAVGALMLMVALLGTLVTGCVAAGWWLGMAIFVNHTGSDGKVFTEHHYPGPSGHLLAIWLVCTTSIVVAAVMSGRTAKRQGSDAS